MKILLTGLLLIFGTLIYAQDGSVSGSVADSKSGNPLEFASVVLYSSVDSSLVAGVITNEDGVFSIPKVKKGSYYLLVQFVGYENQLSEAFILESGQNKKLDPILLLAGSQLLKEVEVSGRQINAVNKLEKQTYKAAQFESARGGTAMDLIRNMPSLAVNGQGDITMRGSSGFLVLINGKPVNTDAQTALSQFPANQISDIEVITSPSAKYDPDGKGGIINIVTKKGFSDGIGLTINSQYGLPGTTTFGNERVALRHGVDAMFNYKKDHWDVSLGGNYNRNDLGGYRVGDVTIENIDNNRVTHFPSEGERSFNRYQYAARANLGYSPDSVNSISFGFFSGKRYQERDANLFYSNSTVYLDNGELIAEHPYYNANKQLKQGVFTLANLDYSHLFRNKSLLSLSLLYEHDNLYGNTFNRNLSEPHGEMIQYVENPYEKPVNGYRMNLDYSVPLGQGVLESGYQYRFDSQVGIFDYLVDPVNPDQKDVALFQGTAQSDNLIHSLYAQYSGGKEKLEYNFGLRYEYYFRTVELSVDPEVHELKLSNFFPSANILYSASEDLQFKAGYSRRIQRSSNNQLNPIPEREHSETLEMGDPDLLPELINLAEIGLIKKFSKQGSVFVTGYYRGVQNPVQRVNSIYADTILYRVYTNIDHGDAYGVEAGADLQLLSWWKLYLGMNLYHQSYQGDLKILNDPAIDIDNSGWVYSVNANTNFNLGAGWSIQANVNYLSKRVTAQGEDSRYLIPNASVRKSFFDNQLVASIQWQNIDLGMQQSHRQRISTWGEHFYTTTNYIYETDFILLNLSYNFNSRTLKNKLPSSEFGEKEF